MYEAWMSWNNEFGYFLNKMGCPYYYNIALCEFDPAEDNYEIFLNWESSRLALHVGNLEFPNSGDVVGYLTQADNLNVLVVRNAGHMVPLSQPVY